MSSLCFKGAIDKREENIWESIFRIVAVELNTVGTKAEPVRLNKIGI